MSNLQVRWSVVATSAFTVFCAVFLIHFVLTANQDTSLDPWLALVDIILLCIALSGAAKATSRRWLMFSFAGLFVLFSAFMVKVVPAKTFTVEDPFATPVSGLPVVWVENLGYSRLDIHGSGNVRGKLHYAETDSRGRFTISQQVSFGLRRVNAADVDVNPDTQEMARWLDITMSAQNKSLNEARFDSEAHGPLVILSPYSISYKTCASIPDAGRRRACLSYSILYSAIKDRDPATCRQYAAAEVKDSLKEPSRAEYLFRPDEMEYECLLFVQGVLAYDSAVCELLHDSPTRFFKTQCQALFGMCKPASDNDFCDPRYHVQFEAQRPLLLADPQGYFCTKDATGVHYVNEIPFMEEAQGLYRKMFCGP